MTAEGDPFSIYIDCCTSEFLCEDAIFEGGSANPTQQNYNELETFIEKYNKEGKRPCVFHFHTHPTKGYYESFSDQDLHLYAKMAYDHPNCNTFGILSFPMQKSMGVSILLPNEPKRINDSYSANFYRYSNIYYCSGNEVYRMGTFDKQYKNRKTDRRNSIVRNANYSNGVKKVCAIGRNPNNNLGIQDSNVGYIDINHKICIADEKVQLCFGQWGRRLLTINIEDRKNKVSNK